MAPRLGRPAPAGPLARSRDRGCEPGRQRTVADAARWLGLRPDPARKDPVRVADRARRHRARLHPARRRRHPHLGDHGGKVIVYFAPGRDTLAGQGGPALQHLHRQFHGYTVLGISPMAGEACRPTEGGTLDGHALFYADQHVMNAGRVRREALYGKTVEGVICSTIVLDEDAPSPTPGTTSRPPATSRSSPRPRTFWRRPCRALPSPSPPPRTPPPRRPPSSCPRPFPRSRPRSPPGATGSPRPS